MKKRYLFYLTCMFLIFLPILILKNETMIVSLLDFIVGLTIIFYLLFFELFLQSKGKNKAHFKFLCLSLAILLIANIVKIVFQIKLKLITNKVLIYDFIFLYISVLNPLMFLILIKINQLKKSIKIVAIISIIIAFMIFVGDAFYQIFDSWRKIY